MDQVDFKRIIASILLLSMFVLSGFQKILTFEKTIDNVANKLSFNMQVTQLGVIVVILLEILAPIIILYYLTYANYAEYAKYAIWLLVIFTIVVTFMYHPPDLTSYYKSIPFWANMSLLGGLLLLESLIEK